VRWSPEGFDRPALAYPNLWTHKVDGNGYLDNGLVRMRPDDRFEGGDYIDPYEMMVCRRLDAQQLYFPDVGAKGVVVSRHPDGGLVCSSRLPAIYRSTDEGCSWERIAEVERTGERPITFGFGVTAKGTFLVSYSDQAKEQGYVARSDDGGTSWTQIPPCTPTRCTSWGTATAAASSSSLTARSC